MYLCNIFTDSDTAKNLNAGIDPILIRYENLSRPGMYVLLTVISCEFL